jgi:hypothetical protein
VSIDDTITIIAVIGGMCVGALIFAWGYLMGGRS